MVMIADSVSCSIFSPTWPREAAPARATWDNRISQCPKILLLSLLLHYFSVVNLFGTSTSLRCVSIVKDCLKGSFLADFFVRRDRAPVGQAGVAHLGGGCHLEMSVSNILFKRYRFKERKTFRSYPKWLNFLASVL